MLRSYQTMKGFPDLVALGVKVGFCYVESEQPHFLRTCSQFFFCTVGLEFCIRRLSCVGCAWKITPHPQTLWEMGGMGLRGGVSAFGWRCFDDDATRAQAFEHSHSYAHAFEGSVFLTLVEITFRIVS